MQVKCKYCNSYLSDTDERCPSCGAVNDLLVRTANGAPKTIEELKEWYVAHNLPDENTTRFFIGKNVESRRAFGIYKDEQTGNFVVYKNKDNGVRAVRYEGKDEAYAVNELYQKLKEEIQNQKGNKVGPGWASGKTNKNNKNNKNSKWLLIHFILIFVTFPLIRVSLIAYYFLFLSLNPLGFIMEPIICTINDSSKAKKIDKYWHLISIVIFLIILLTTIGIRTYNHRNDAYYENNNVVYYHYGNDWYYYDNDSWTTYYGDTSNFNYLDDDYSSTYDVSDFKDSSYWSSSSSSSSSSDWDSDSSWSSSDSWDSSSTDWDSDW